MTNPNDPAFAHEGHRYLVDKELQTILPVELASKIVALDHRYQGLTKREYFAAMAMQCICANSIPGNHHMPNATAKDAVMYADALIAELSK